MRKKPTLTIQWTVRKDKKKSSQEKKIQIGCQVFVSQLAKE